MSMQSKKHMKNYQGQIRGIKFLIKDNKTIRLWKPDDVEVENFRPLCDLVVKYIIDEGFFNKKNCKVEIVF